jgi:hypothetical protein
MTMLTPPQVSRPPLGDNQFFTFTKMVETPTLDTLIIHQNAVNTVLLDMKLNSDYTYNIFTIVTSVYTRAQPMPEQRYLTTIHYGALAAYGDGPGISGV